MHATSRFDAPADLVGRLLLASLFLVAGLQKITGFDGVAGWMESMGVSSALLPFVIALEIGGALLVAAGYRTRETALALAGFTLAAAVLFHRNLADETQFLMFMKNVVIAGGFLVLASKGAGAWSLDARRTRPAHRARIA